MRISVLLTLTLMTFFSTKDPAQAQALDITKVAQGTLQEIKASSIRILCDSNDSKMQITIDSNTVYDNAQKLTDFKAGDKVQVEYQKKQGKNIAITITKMEVES